MTLPSIGQLLVVLVLAAITWELWLKSRLWPKFKLLGGLAMRAGRFLSSRKVSDHWKERASTLYARRIFAISLAGLMWFVAMGLPWWVSMEWLALSVNGVLLGGTCALVPYALLRKVIFG